MQQAAEKNEAPATTPNTMKSLAPLRLAALGGVWQSATMAVAPMKPTFQPMPSRISDTQKWKRPSPDKRDRGRGGGEAAGPPR